jgi:hypothetical protein
MSGCRHAQPELKKTDYIDSLLFNPETTIVNTESPVKRGKPKYTNDSLNGDTLWMNDYTGYSLYDTLISADITACIEIRVDTNDYIIDTIRTAVGNRLAVGYNHIYSIDFNKERKPWFRLVINKKKDLAGILDVTDTWLESNLDIIRRIFYNSKYDRVIVELNINNHTDFGLLYYLIADTKGVIKYIGTANTWGGESPDGESFLTQNNEMFVTCSEIYNFRKAGAMSLSEYASMAGFRSMKDTLPQFIPVHGLRDLTNNHILAIFNRSHNEPVFNAFILTTDTTVISRFSYYGIIEEMEAVLLYAVDPRLHRSFLYDTDREKLICINNSVNPKVRELGIKNMKAFPTDSSMEQNLTQLDFNLYGSYDFYISSADSAIYYRKDKFK